MTAETTKKREESPAGLRSKASRAYARQSSEDLEEKRILDYLPLVRHIVQKVTDYVSRRSDMEDLISAGTLGLVRASKAFDPTRNADFKTYAYIRVKGAVIDELRSMSFAPSSAHKRIRNVRQSYQRFVSAKGVPPGDEELAMEAGISVTQLYRTLEEARRLQFLSIHGLGGDQEDARGAIVPLDGSARPDARAEQREMLDKLSQAMQELPKRDRLLLLLYYERDLTMKETGEVLGITESRVCQIHASALFKLSMKLRSAP